MTTLIFWSCAVSALTLFILLWRKHTPSQRILPSAFLGAASSIAPLKIKLSTPPWLGWLLVLLFTLGAALAYFPPTANFSKNAQNEAGLLWVDNTLSGHLAFAEDAARLQQTATAISALSLRLYGLQERFKSASSRNLSSPEANYEVIYEIVPLNSVREMESFLRARMAEPPLPFSRPLSAPALAKALSTEAAFSQGKGTFVAISDGQRETLQMTSALKPLFAKTHAVFVPLATSLVGEREELVPTELFTLWQEKAPSNAPFAVFNSDASQIPMQARPALYREKFSINAGSDARAFFIPAAEANPNGKSLPMITGCALQLPGPLEFDSFADLRAFAQFFEVPLRLQTCSEKAGEVQHSQENDPWKYRRQTIWAVQTDDEIYNTLKNRGEMWVPQGFAENADSVVYVASHRLRFSAGLLERVPVQLDANMMPSPLFLMPEPSPQLGFEPVFSGTDKIPLGYQNKKTGTFFYLRTTAAMPNGELGRSSRWTQFWFDVAQQTKQNTPSVRRTLYSDIQGFLEAAPLTLPEGRTPQRNRTAKLNMDTLQWISFDSNPSAQQQNSARPEAGLYLLDSKNNSNNRSAPGTSSSTSSTSATLDSAALDTATLEFVAFAPEERTRSVYTPEEFEASWTTQTSNSATAAGQKQNSNLASNKRALAGALLGAAACALLWFVAPRKGWSVVVFGLVAAAASAAFPKPAWAQSQLPPGSGFPRDFFKPRSPLSTTRTSGASTIPFRIAWCDSDVSPALAARYTFVRNLLANRGTIEMPLKLTPGGCRPGVADMWWTDNARGMNSKLLSEHLSSGGLFVMEGQAGSDISTPLLEVADVSVGMTWETPKKRGLLYRSFYLLQTFDGCPDDHTKLLSLRKKPNAHSPMGILTSARFLSVGGTSTDCFGADDDYRSRSFVNMMYSFLATDYKEDQLQLPEILNRVRSLGLEP